MIRSVHGGACHACLIYICEAGSLFAISTYSFMHDFYHTSSDWPTCISLAMCCSVKGILRAAGGYALKQNFRSDVEQN